MFKYGIITIDVLTYHHTIRAIAAILKFIDKKFSPRVPKCHPSDSDSEHAKLLKKPIKHCMDPKTCFSAWLPDYIGCPFIHCLHCHYYKPLGEYPESPICLTISLHDTE